MKSLRNLLLLISLSPLILVLIISAANVNNKSKLNIFIWKTPELHFGTYLALGVSLGFISTFTTSISFAPKINLKSTKRYIFNKEVDSDFEEYNIREDLNSSDINDYKKSVYTKDKYIDRDPRDSYPTVTVPYKIRKNANPTERNSSRKQKSIYSNDYISNNNETIEDRTNQYNRDNDWSNNDYENW
tara:strand:- start:525 stop:1085 length:561 start_codon:yes stop_codon:yes gene_type:complete